MAKDEAGMNDGQERRLVKGAAVLHPRQLPADSQNRVEEAPIEEQADYNDELQVRGLFLGGHLDGVERQAFAYASTARMGGIKIRDHPRKDGSPQANGTRRTLIDPRYHDKKRGMAEHKSQLEDVRRQQTEERIEAIEKELAKDSFCVESTIRELVNSQNPGMLVHCAKMY